MFWFTASSDNTTQYIISVILPTKAGNGQFNSFWSGKKDECCYIRLEECLLSGRVDESCSPLTVPWVLQVQLQMFDYMSTVEAAVMSYQTVYHKYNICICKWLREEQTIQLCVWMSMTDKAETGQCSECVFFTDNCGWQSKNKTIAGIYLHAITSLPVEHITTIT